MRELTPDMLLRAYAYGVFPMAGSRDGQELHWLDPEWRGIIPLQQVHVPRRLARTIRAERFEVRIDTAFDAVIRACAEPRPGHEDTWINAQIRELYNTLFARGLCHSVECWRGGKLAGGIYGLQMGAMFFGESMFSHQRDASKVALVHLAARLRAGGFQILDTQFLTPHLAQFGGLEISRARYRQLLARTIHQICDFYSLPGDISGAGVLQSITEMS